MQGRKCGALLDGKLYYSEQDHVCSITPIEFEKYCREILLGYAEKEQLTNFSIDHDVKLVSNDGEYQIDLYATFTALNVEMRIICECKQYKNRVKREKVVILADKVKSLGAQKEILLSTSAFQSGAIQYAKTHRIALIRVYDQNCEFYSHSSGSIKYDENAPFLYGERRMPLYRAEDCIAETEYPCIVYPTKSMVKTIYRDMNQIMYEQWGIGFELPF